MYDVSTSIICMYVFVDLLRIFSFKDDKKKTAFMLKAIVRIGGADAAESQGPAQSLRSVVKPKELW